MCKLQLDNKIPHIRIMNLYLKILFFEISFSMCEVEYEIARIYDTPVLATLSFFSCCSFRDLRVFRNTLEIENYVHIWYRIRRESVPWVPSDPKSRTEWKQSSWVRFGAFEPAKAVDIDSLWVSGARHTPYEFQIKSTPSSCMHTHIYIQARLTPKIS